MNRVLAEIFEVQSHIGVTGTVPEDIENLDLSHVWHPYTQMADYGDEQLIICKAQGATVTDIHGKKYIDAVGGLWCVNAGYGRTNILTAMASQAADASYVSLFGRSHVPGIQLAKELASIAPNGLNHVFFSNGGTEAVETSIKIARQYFSHLEKSQKKKVLSFKGGWHGCTLGALAASGIDGERSLFLEDSGQFIHLPYPSEEEMHNPDQRSDYFRRFQEAILRMDPNTIAALLFEPIQGVGGMRVPTREFYQELQKICRLHNILLIADEITTGFGRIGKMFACEHFDIELDMMVIGKGLTSGYAPLSATLVSDEIYREFLSAGKHFIHGYTFGGHPTACAAAMENIATLQREKLPERAEALGARMLGRLRESLENHPRISAIRGKGLLMAIVLKNKQNEEPMSQIDSRKICTTARKNGLIVRSLDNIIPICPPLSISDEEADKICDILVSAIKDENL
ncbi:aspartate aminotransferase family protein [Candidatus Peregrinibacteria bacterium]|nr:aspartate aminotransferase family protein [Candidatus Peregrinibacteria bacterium]